MFLRIVVHLKDERSHSAVASSSTNDLVEFGPIDDTFWVNSFTSLKESLGNSIFFIFFVHKFILTSVLKCKFFLLLSNLTWLWSTTILEAWGQLKLCCWPLLLIWSAKLKLAERANNQNNPYQVIYFLEWSIFLFQN